MMSRGRPAKIDGNHAEIRSVLRDIGAMVVDLSAVGAGVPDLMVLYRGNIRLLEVKDGAKSPSRRRLTPDQRTWHQMADARGVKVAVVTNTDEAILAVCRVTS